MIKGMKVTLIQTRQHHQRQNEFSQRQDIVNKSEQASNNTTLTKYPSGST